MLEEKRSEQGDDPNVMLGIGSVVMGKVTVADHVIVGANAVVTRSILEENVSVAGAPAKIVSKQGTRKSDKESGK